MTLPFEEPLISVITVTLNSEKYLVDTINSVASQTYQNIEHIIIDGGSKDQTIPIIKDHENSISKWISEQDDGISDAMNKGINLSSGDYIIFLHSDDYFISTDVITKAVRFLNKKNHIYLFKVKLDDGNKQTYSSTRNLGPLTNFKMGSCHQGHICSKHLFDDIGKFSSRLKITMDYDLILRAYRAGYKSVSINMVLSHMRLIGISSQSDWEGLSRRFSEEKAVHNINAKTLSQVILYKLYWPIYITYRKALYLFREKT